VQLQKGPLGLLGAFALKVGGQNPTGFGDSVVPVAEVMDHYLATSELNSVVVNGLGGLVASVTRAFVVPAGKVWRVIGAGMQVGLNAADVALKSNITIGISSPNGGLPGTIVLGGTDQGGAVFRSSGIVFRPPLFLPSGWSVQETFLTSAAMTVSVQVFGTLLYQEFDL